jgi:ankyrin repeat protein
MDDSLILAIEVDEPNVVQMLVDFGADLFKRDEEGRTPLMIACKISEKSIAVLINDSSYLNLVDNSGWTALIHLIIMGKQRNKEELVKLLLKKGADPNIKDLTGKTALMWVARYTKFQSSERIIKILLKYGADPNIGDNLGFTALMQAIMSFHSSTEKTIRILARKSDLSVQDNYGDTVLDNLKKMNTPISKKLYNIVASTFPD